MNIFHSSQDLKSKLPKVVSFESVMDKIKATVKEFRIDVKDVFRDFDRLRSGRITKAKFRTGVNMCKFKLSGDELECLEDRFELPGKTDMVSISQFITDIDSVFVTKGLIGDPDAEVKEFKKKKPKFELGVLNEQQMEDFKALMDQLAMITHQNRVKMRRFFAEHDKGVRNRVKQSEFRAVMSILNINLTNKDLTLLTQRFGIEHYGTKLDINYAAFCDEVEALEVRRSSIFKSLMQRMRAQFRKRGARGIHGLATIFRRMDSFDGNRQLDKQEFLEGLAAFGFHVSKTEGEQLLKAYDRNNDGVVSYDEFIRGMRGALNTRRLKMIVKAFKKMDKDGSGVMTIEDLKGVFDAKHHPKVISGDIKEADALEIFINSFDGSQIQDGKVTLDEFEDYYSNVSSSIDDDEYFVRMMEKVWAIEEYEYET